MVAASRPPREGRRGGSFLAVAVRRSFIQHDVMSYVIRPRLPRAIVIATVLSVIALCVAGLAALWTGSSAPDADDLLARLRPAPPISGRWLMPDGHPILIEGNQMIGGYDDSVADGNCDEFCGPGVTSSTYVTGSADGDLVTISFSKWSTSNGVQGGFQSSIVKNRKDLNSLGSHTYRRAGPCRLVDVASGADSMISLDPSCPGPDLDWNKGRMIARNKEQKIEVSMTPVHYSVLLRQATRQENDFAVEALREGGMGFGAGDTSDYLKDSLVVDQGLALPMLLVDRSDVRNFGLKPGKVEFWSRKPSVEYPFINSRNVDSIQRRDAKIRYLKVAWLGGRPVSQRILPFMALPLSVEKDGRVLMLLSRPKGDSPWWEPSLAHVRMDAPQEIADNQMCTWSIFLVRQQPRLRLDAPVEAVSLGTGELDSYERPYLNVKSGGNPAVAEASRLCPGRTRP